MVGFVMMFAVGEIGEAVDFLKTFVRMENEAVREVFEEGPKEETESGDAEGSWPGEWMRGDAPSDERGGDRSPQGKWPQRAEVP